MKKLFYILFVFFITSFISKVSAQTQTRCIVIDGDSIPVVDLPVVCIGKKTPIASIKFRSKRESRQYRRMKYHVRKVYPYAQLAAQKLRECEAEIDSNPAAKKAAMKKMEKALKDRYGKELKKLTMTQGKVLLLLIDRQTGNTTFDLVKELRGGFSASMYQGVARLFSSNLKVNYDGNGKDWMIEDICKRIENGEFDD